MYFKKVIIAVSCLVTSTYLWAANYETLPKGVRLAAISRIDVNPVNEWWENSQQRNSLGKDFQLNARNLEGVDELNSAFFSALKQTSPNAYEKFTAGNWSLQANADVEVWGAGFGWGVTDRVTLYGIGTFWKARVSLDLVQKSKNNYEQTQDAILNDKHHSGPILDPGQFPQITSGMIQSVVTNYYGYKPLGEWSTESIGDLELGAKILIDSGKWGGFSISPGVIVPTGSVDDPDILQDFSIGDGFWSAYLEFETAFYAFEKLSLELGLRWSYQFPTSVVQRIPTSGESALSSEKGEFDYYPGLRWDFNLGIPIRITDWFSIHPKYLFEFDQADDYRSSNYAANNWLGQNTQMFAHIYRVDVVADSVRAFFAKKFDVPMSGKFSFQKVFKGQNVPSVSRSSLEFRIYF